MLGTCVCHRALCQTSLTIWEIARLENRTLFWFQTFEFRLSNLLKVPTFPLTKSLTYRLERLAFWPGPLADRRCIGRSRGTARTDECSAGTFPSLLGSYCRGRTEEKQIVSSIIYKWISVLISLNFKLLNWNHRYPSISTRSFWSWLNQPGTESQNLKIKWCSNSCTLLEDLI